MVRGAGGAPGPARCTWPPSTAPDTPPRAAPPEAGPPRRRVAAGVFVDASYEGDLPPAAGVPYRVGRESRAEHNEQHAGRIFTRHGRGHFPREAHEGHLNLGTFPVVGQEIFAGSSGEGDGLVQTYNYRICLSRDPQIRRYPERPATYSREDYSALLEDQATNLHHPPPSAGVPAARRAERPLRPGHAPQPQGLLEQQRLRGGPAALPGR